MTKKLPKALPPEWSHFVEAEKIGSSPMKIKIEPNDEERKALAVRLGIKALESLKAELVFLQESGKMTVHVSGHFKAQVTQTCVVSGKPVKEDIEESFEGWFADRSKTVPLARARHDKQTQKGKAEKPILDESEDPEAIIEGKIDAGELVTQYLSLAINPYPHAEGVAYEHGDESEAISKEGFENPFAALKEWKSNKPKD